MPRQKAVRANLEIEAAEENAAVEWWEKQNYKSLKLNLSGNNGWPDRLFILPEGRTIWFEFKRGAEQPDPLQYSRIRTLLFLEHEVYVVNSAKAAIAILEAALLPRRRCPLGCIPGVFGSSTGPRTWEDVDRLDDLQDIEGHGLCEESPSSEHDKGNL